MELGTCRQGRGRKESSFIGGLLFRGPWSREQVTSCNTTLHFGFLCKSYSSTLKPTLKLQCLRVVLAEEEVAGLPEQRVHPYTGVNFESTHVRNGIVPRGRSKRRQQRHGSISVCTLGAHQK